MKLLQKILQKAIAEGALQIRLSVNSAPVGLQPLGESAWDELGVLDENYIRSLFQALIRKGVQTEPAKGEAQIPNFGKLLIIAEPGPPAKINIYLPDGHHLFPADWQAASSPPVIEAPIVEAPVAPPIAFEPSGFVPNFGALNDALPNNLFQMPKPPPPPPLTTKLAKTAPGEFIPPGMGDLSEPAFAASALSPPPVAAPPIAAPSVASPISSFDFLKKPQAILTSVPNPVSFPVAALPKEHEEPSAEKEEEKVKEEVEEERAQAPVSFAQSSAHEFTSQNGAEKPIDKFLQLMLKQKASDLHLTTGEPICFRIDGEIRRGSQRRVSAEEMTEYLRPIMPSINRKEFEDCNDTDFAYEIQGLARFRVNVFRDRHGVGAVLRHIPNEILSFTQLGLPPILKNFCRLSKCFIVVTGPTGSGKSTTLAAMVDHMNRHRRDHILTIEDPIEFVHPQKNCLIRQRELKRHTTSFSRALRAALREDPDIILVGELRDLETTAAAIEMAETGHLVMGTLHTTTAISTIDRIIDQFPADQQAQIRVMLAESLKGVVAQTLVKKKEGGRVAAIEILICNQAVSSLIRESKSHMIGNHMQSQRAEGNIMLNDALTELVMAGLIEPEQAWIKAVQKQSLIERFKSKRIDISFLDKDSKTNVEEGAAS